jgi:glycosyltransferase involved in cell wall biosynthesis
MKVLWLASWYPDPYELTNGDFVQRHAVAVARIIPVDVIHVIQVGGETNIKKHITCTRNGNLREWVIGFSFKKWGWGWLDKVRYHIKFRYFYRVILFRYVSRNGKPDLLHVHIPMKAGLLARKFSRYWNIPYLVTEHSSLYDPLAADNFSKRSFFFRYHTLKIFRQAAAVTCVSAAIGDKIRQITDISGIKVIYNVVDTTRFNYQSDGQSHNYQVGAPSLNCQPEDQPYRPRINDQPLNRQIDAQSPSAPCFKWLHVSSLQPLKNITAVIQAFQQLYLLRQDWVFEIVGPADETLVRLVKESDLSDRISFAGETDHLLVAEKMKESSALVLFSKYENFPCVIIEALCCGLPVVSSDVGGVSEAINKSNGILVESENIQQLTQAMNRIMTDYFLFDRNLIARDAASKYDESVIGSQFVRLYNQLFFKLSN